MTRRDRLAWGADRRLLNGGILLCLLLLLLTSIDRADWLRRNLTLQVVVVAAQAGDVGPAQAVLAAGDLAGLRADLLAWGVGMILADEGQLDSAAALWQQMDPATQSQLDALLRTEATANEVAGSSQTAERTLRTRIALLPGDWRTYNSLGDFLLRQSRQEEAAGVFTEGARRLPDAAAAYLAGRAAESLRDWETAREQYTRAASGDPELAAQAYYRLAVILRQRFGDAAGAIVTCTRGIAQAPAFYACYELLGLLYMETGNYEQAKSWYNAGLAALTGTSYESLFWRRLAEVELAQGLVVEAVTTFRHGLALKISDAQAHRGLARALVGLGDFAGASASQEAAIRWQATQRPVPAQWYAELGQYYAWAGDTQAAQAAFDAALAIDATNADVRQGRIELESGK